MGRASGPPLILRGENEMGNEERAKNLISNMNDLIKTYNYNVTCDDRDDIDRGEASGIRRALRLLGFEVEYADDKTIKSIRMPEYADDGFLAYE